MLLVTAGMIGTGKSSVAKILGEHFKSEVFYESVEDNPILPLFYKASDEEKQKERYPFKLQLWFLNTRYKSIKQALVHNNNVLDRSIYEDLYFATKNMEKGDINELEMLIYKSLLDNMLEELKELPKKSPDLLIYLKASFETVIKRIRLRGREYELDEKLLDYYYLLWKDYDNWIEEHYKASDIIIIDMDKIDVVNSTGDRNLVIKMVEDKLTEIRK